MWGLGQGAEGRKLLAKSGVGFLHSPFLVWSRLLMKEMAVLPDFSACRQHH